MLNLFLWLTRFTMPKGKGASLPLKLTQWRFWSRLSLSPASNPKETQEIPQPYSGACRSRAGLLQGCICFVRLGVFGENPAGGPGIFLMPSTCQALCKSYLLSLPTCFIPTRVLGAWVFIIPRKLKRLAQRPQCWYAAEKQLGTRMQSSEVLDIFRL